MTPSDLADIQVIYQTRTERAVCIRETEDGTGTPEGGDRVMVGNVYHLWNGSKWTQYESISDAEGAADDAIDAARDCCDPEWPAWVTEICVFSAP